MSWSPGRWSRLGVFALATAVVMWFAFVQALSAVSQRSQPTVALRLAPGNPVALVRDATLRLSAGDKTFTGNDALDAARRSVLAMPLNGPAMELLGLVLSSNGAQMDRQREVLLVASSLDRHDPATQLVLIEEAVARDDVPTALDRYDMVLRIDPNARTLLYPVLTSALDDPAIRRRFAPYLTAPPPWMATFLRFAVSTTDHPASLVALARQGGGFPQGAPYSSLPAELLSRIIGVGEYRLAIDFYRDLPRADMKLLRSLDLTESNTRRDLAPITWQLFEIDGIDALFVADDAGGLAIEARIDALYSGPVARKVVTIDPGAYRLDARVVAVTPPPGSSVRFRLSCVSGSTSELLSQTIALSGSDTVRARVQVPEGCAAQEMMISVENPTGAALDLTITGVHLTRL